MPWLQWRLPSKTKIAGVTMSTPSTGGDLLRNVEVRVGNTKVDSEFRGRISVNKLCGEFLGPGNNRRAYTIVCGSYIQADFITVQILNSNAKLQINELELITSFEGIKNFGYKYIIFPHFLSSG